MYRNDGRGVKRRSRESGSLSVPAICYDVHRQAKAADVVGGEGDVRSRRARVKE